MELAYEWIGQYGYLAIFLLLLFGIVGLPVPDETLLLFVGYLSFKGDLQVVPALGTAFVGSACGISVSYALGRFVGIRAITKIAPRLHIRAEHLALTYRWVDRWGKYVLLVAYFIPGVRHLAGLVLGASLLPPLVFARFAYAGALVWTSTFIGLGYVAGEEWHRRSFAQSHIWGIGMIVVVLALVIILLVVWRRARPG